MEPMSLTVGAVVAALVLKGADRAGEKMTESGLAAIDKLAERVRGRFRERADAAANAALARVEDPPAGPTQLASLAAAVERHAREDPAFAEELRHLVHDAEAADGDMRHAPQVAIGSRISQVQDTRGSTIHVSIGEAAGQNKHIER